jgi:hypothetical protein
MKRTILATCLAGACAVALSAQTPTQQTPPTSTAGTTGATSTDTDASQRSRGGPVTVTGCLKAGDTAGTFTLTNVKGMGRPGGATTGESTGAAGTTAGAAGTTAGGATGGQHAMGDVMLNASSTVDLKPHVGHQIEVTGTPARGGSAGATTTGAAGDTTAAAGTATGGTAAGGATTATSGQTGRGPRSLNVTSIKMVSDTCSQQ